MQSWPYCCRTNNLYQPACHVLCRCTCLMFGKTVELLDTSDVNLTNALAWLSRMCNSGAQVE